MGRAEKVYNKAWDERDASDLAREKIEDERDAFNLAAWHTREKEWKERGVAAWDARLGV